MFDRRRCRCADGRSRGEQAVLGRAPHGTSRPFNAGHLADVPQQAHALTPLLTEADPPSFPFLVLLVSGGHTQIVLAQGINSFRIVLDKLDLSVG